VGRVAFGDLPLADLMATARSRPNNIITGKARPDQEVTSAFDRHSPLDDSLSKGDWATLHDNIAVRNHDKVREENGKRGRRIDFSVLTLA